MEFDDLPDFASFRSYPGYHPLRARRTHLQRIPATPRPPFGFTPATDTSLSSFDFDPNTNSSTSQTPSPGYSYYDTTTTATSSSSAITPDSASDVDNNCWHSSSSLHGIGTAFRRIYHSRPNYGGLPSLVSRCEHISVIELPGASAAGVRIFLAHEFVQSSVAGLLRRSMMMTTTDPDITAISTWISRLNVAADVARGLDHIHNTKGIRSSILASKIVRASSIIIVSVGCGGLRDESGLSIRSSSLAMMNQEEEEIEVAAAEENERTDVYTYGGMILELISGEEPRAAVIEVARAVVDGRVLKWMWNDTRMEDSFPDKLVENLLRIAVNCLNEDPRKRPEIASVAGNIYRLCLESREWSNGGGDLWQGLHQRTVVPGGSFSPMGDIIPCPSYLLKLGLS